jgi:hypothetical protein
MVPREKKGHGNYHWKTNTISKLMRKVVNNQLSEIPNEDKVMIFNQNQNTTQLELNKIDPTNLNGKIIKTTSTIKIVEAKKQSIPENVSYFIDGKK